MAGRDVRGELPPDPDRILRASLVDEPDDLAAEAARFRPAFRHLALLVQVPGVDLDARMEAEKGAPLDDPERAILAQRVAVARAWLAEFAPDRYRVEVREDGLPDEAAVLDEAQRAYLAALADAAADERPAAGDAWQDLIFRTAQARELSSAQAFGAHLPGVPRPAQRAARGLAAGQPRAGLRRRTAARRGGVGRAAEATA